MSHDNDINIPSGLVDQHNLILNSDSDMFSGIGFYRFLAMLF